MKKYITLVLTTALLISCGQKEASSASIDALIEGKKVTELQAKKSQLQADINKIDAALSALNVKVDEALVGIATVKDTLFTHYLEVQGNVDTKENILIQPEFSGTLIALNVKAGQQVSKGQILGRVDDAGLSQQLASLENQYALAKTNFDRQKNLWDKKIGSEMQYLQAQTNMVTAQKGVAQLKAQLAKTIIRAPFTGTIDEVYVEKGQVVGPGSPQGLMRIVNVSNMYVSTTVPETYVGKLKVGTEVDVLLTSIGKMYKGKVRQVGKFINPSNRSFGIEVSVPNPQGLLRPNQVAKLRIIDYTNKNAVVVPSNVIQKDADGNSYVYTVIDRDGKTGKAKKTIVKTGQSSDNLTEILEGVSADDVIVTDGVNTISEGMKLNF
ncbi:RND family efflux transporter, MFP subunit [Flavobacterium fontis]|jgi:membrane fusion protein (multidrug efflux system)|uniref:RND family efflux transporter, MFP subunit n=1 Tax=Flavobacterium fontis TaxID=1124188 RepID=A0A1M4WK24_9FLAO|nr:MULTISPECIES: efflux RND transporter periplasmic adaptor subunit [Flavobacterium]MCZ8169302.1 efflux RND transporter periplasmic adaptor subunit [Flavobacterium sp.]MCZ8298465.1 efflux RND transporter periplasmic adaptor subunit [Flavobacterium sp.]SHE81510.1 RND family efflux transporter, MFP subunit [Flavobacterium fontis]